MAMHHKNINFDSWLENMQKVTTEGDDIALYILARMYNKHVFIHNPMYGWSTLPYRMEDSYKDVVCKCDLELMYLKCWAFGEVKKICGPASVPDAGKNTPKKPKEPKTKPSVIPSNVIAENVIPHNVPSKSDCTLRKRAVAVPKKVTECKSNRKRQIVDYSKLDAGADEPSAPHKHRKPNLLCKPSKTVLAAHKKHKMMSPLSAGKMAATTIEQSVHVPCTEAKASTSTSTTAKAETSLISTLTVNASKEETETAIAALLSLGSDIPPPDEDLTAENAVLVPINPNIAHTNTGKTAHKTTASTDPPAAKTTAVPVHKRFVTVEYKLKQKYRQPRKFPCAKCGKSSSTQKEVNGHFKETHPPVKCDYCD